MTSTAEVLSLKTIESDNLNDKAVAEAFNTFRVSVLFANRRGCDISLQILEQANLQFSVEMAAYFDKLFAFVASDRRFTELKPSIEIAADLIARSYLLRTLRIAKVQGFALVTSEKLRKLNDGALNDGSELSQHAKLCCLEAIVHFQSQGDQVNSETVTAACALIWPN